MSSIRHSYTLIDDDRHYSRVEATITGLAEAGYDVLAVFMPHVTESADPDFKFDHCKVINTDLVFLTRFPHTV